MLKAAHLQTGCRGKALRTKQTAKQFATTGLSRPSVVCRSYDWNGRPSWDSAPEPTEVVEEVAAASNGLFNESFKSALADALSRSGPSALTYGEQRKEDDGMSGQEEVLRAALISSRSTLTRLQHILAETEKAIELETKQMERLQFALEKARNDAAYYRSLAQMIDQGGANSDDD